jgi:hypothetical protein
MRGLFLDLDSGEIGFSMGNNTLMSSDGHFMSRMSDNSALDFETGEIHLISSFGFDDDDR